MSGDAVSKLITASLRHTETAPVVYSTSLLDVSPFNRTSSPRCNSFTLPGKSHSFYLMRCFYVQFPSPCPIIMCYATAAHNKTMDSLNRPQQSKLGETFK